MKAYVIINWYDSVPYFDPVADFCGITLSKEAAEEEAEKYYVAWEEGGYSRSTCPVCIVEVELSNKVFVPNFDDEEESE